MQFANAAKFRAPLCMSSGVSECSGSLSTNQGFYMLIQAVRRPLNVETQLSMNSMCVCVNFHSSLNQNLSFNADCGVCGEVVWGRGDLCMVWGGMWCVVTYVLVCGEVELE